MTQVIYTQPVFFQTNGDCSSFEIVFPDDESDDFIEGYRQNLIKQGFPVYYPSLPQPKRIVFSVLAMPKYIEKWKRIKTRD